MARCATTVGSVLVGVFASCEIGGPSAVCTTEFRAVLLAVRDRMGAPVPGLAISDTILRTGQAFDVAQIPGLPSGSYDVFDDNLKDRIRRTGDSVRVAGTGAGAGFRADFVFDVPGGCHVRRRSGPATVILP